MRAVMSAIPPQILEWRRRTGAGQWDEMWEGVLHMAPSPNRDHQEFEYRLLRWLDDHWAQPNGCRVYHQINVSGPGKWSENYRIPDLVLLTPDRFHIDRNEYFDGGPDAVVEIHSPEDEAYDKFEFYAKVGVREVWVINRDSKQPEIFKLVGTGYENRKANMDGWVSSVIAGVEMRADGGERLEIRLADRPETSTKLP